MSTTANLQSDAPVDDTQEQPWRWLPDWAIVPLAIFITVVSGASVTGLTWTLAGGPAVVEVKGQPLDMARVAAGHRLYMASCAACHGPDARGMTNLGKNLRMGFAASTPDNDLAAMIIRGRNPGEPGHTSVAPMPPLGGRTDFNESNIADVVVYLRSLQDPSRVSGPEPEVHVAVLDDEHVEEPVNQPVVTSASNANSTAPSETTVAAAFDQEAATRGKRVYMNCIACHGKDGKGLANLGADLIHSEFVKTKSDQELVDFVKKGRLPSDPESKLKLTMPPKGGNPALKDNQIQDVIAYVRSLQAQASASGK